MSNISIMSSLPRTIIRGFKDSSRRAVPLPSDALPIYLPWYMLFTQWGPDNDALFVEDSAFLSIYGNESFDHMLPYAKHASECARRTLAKGNAAMITRITPPDADIARMRFALEVVADELPEYERNPDGAYKRDARGNLIETGQTVYGMKGRMILQPIGKINNEYQFGRGKPSQGTMTSSTGELATIYPIMDIETRFKGKRGNNIGVRIATPTMSSSDPIDGDLVDEMSACIHRMWIVERADRFKNAQIQLSMQGESYIDFTLKPNTINRFTERPYFSDEVILDEYEERDPNQRSGFGLLGRMHTYAENVQFLQSEIYAEEVNYGTVNDLAENPEHTIDLFTARHYNDVPYHSFILAGPLEGGLQFSENTTHFAIGGSDGDLSDTTYDNLVAEHLANFSNGEISYLDSARYPFSVWTDTGYSLDTKKKAINIWKRRDTFIDLSTQDAMRPMNSASEDSSIGISLRAWFRSLPESAYYGTPACRASIWIHSGQMHDTKYRGILPFTVAIAELSAEYMGAGDGIMKDQLEFDSARNGRSIITQYRNHNVRYREETARNKDWNNGLNFAQYFDRRSIHWPGQQTIYDNPTSILNTRINAIIGCNATRIGEQAWRRFTGEAKLDNLQLVTEVDKYIRVETHGRYDGRCTVIPESTYTQTDVLAGDRWTTHIGIYGRGAKNVETLIVEFHRESDLTEGAN